MKRVLIACFAILLLFSFGKIVCASVDETFEVAIVTSEGDVLVDENADGKWGPAVIGMRLKSGAIIKTGYASTIDIVFDAEGLNVVNIDENTQVTITKDSMKMMQGSLLVKFDNLKEGSQFVVKTPNAACGIRGSGMGIDYDHIAKMTVVKAYEDVVYVTGYDSTGKVVTAEFTIPEGWKAIIRDTGIATPPEELSENELMIWNAWVEVLTGEYVGSKDNEKKVKDLEEELDDEENNLDNDNKDLEEEKTEEHEISPSE
jgi:Fe-S cluster assembly iron-binding protein IscA